MFKRYVYLEGLTSLFGSKGKFLINNNGQIKDVNGNDIDFRRDDEGNRIVHCSGWNGEKDHRVIDLVAIQFKGLRIPIEDYDSVIAFVIDGNKNNTHASNIGYRFRDGKLEHRRAPGFYYVPGVTSISIDKDGNVIHSEKRECRSLYTTKPNEERNIKGGYKTFSATFSKSVQLNYPRHRALCLVFKPYPNNVDSITVNHINGIPGDDRLENLEWATYSENNKHAYVNDLKNQHHRVLVRDVFSGTVVEYYSLSECARALGHKAHATILFRINSSKFGKVFREGTQIKLKNDPRPWVIPVNPAEEVALAQENVQVVVRNCTTMEEVEYDSITEAAKATDVKRGTISYRLKLGDMRPLFGWQFKAEEDQRAFPDFTEQQYRSSLVPNDFPVQARNLLTGEEKTFQSVRKAKKELCNKYLSEVLRQGRQPLLASGWQIKYVKDAWEVIEDFEEAIYKLQRTVMSRNEETGEVRISDSAMNLGKKLGLDSKAIRVAAYRRGNKLYHGYRFRLGATSDPWPIVAD